jgi:ATP-binding cassette subfamily C protein
MLDGATIDQWSPESLGPSIGYLPQDVQLFDGTVAENIARFSPEPDPEAVIVAATAAGFHEQILALREGYDTRIGMGGAQLLRTPSGPRCEIAFNKSTVRSSSSSGKSATTIDIPASANLLHIARPIPRAAPVTTATLPG